MKKNKLTIALFSMFILLLGLTIYTGLGVMADEPEVLLKKTTLVYDENSGIVIDNGDITFNDKNQTVSYKLLLENTQDYDVKVSDIKLSTPTEKFLEFEVENNIDIIESNSTKELVLSLETTGIKGWGRNFNDKLTANISFEKIEKEEDELPKEEPNIPNEDEKVEESLPEPPATNTEELISQTEEIEIKNITKDTIEFTEDFKVEKGEKVAVWIYSEPIFLGYFDVIEENGVKKIAGLEEALEKANIKSGDHTIAITTEEETIGYISVYIDEEKEILKENPSPDVSNKDENIVEEEIENVVPNPNTSDKELIVILGLLTSITGMLVIVVSRNKISRYAVLVILLGTTITTTNAEKLIDIPLTINVNFKSQNITKTSAEIAELSNYTSYIKNIYIQNEKREIESYIHAFDFSANNDNRVKAYIVGNKDNQNFLDIYIQADGIIYLNSDASYYFAKMINLDLIDNLEGIDTSNITNMSYMFYETGFNSSEFSLDLSSFDTSNVTNMKNMFDQTGYNNPNFTLNLGDSFDTSNVTNMNSMFKSTGYNNPNFTLNLGDKFDTSKVTDMNSMFYETGFNSTKINLTLNILNPNIADYQRFAFGVATKEGTQFKINYTSKTGAIVDDIMKKYSEGTNMVKGDLLYIDFDNLEVGDEVSIADEKFNVLGLDGDNVTLLSKYNIGEDNKQTEIPTLYSFSNSVYWSFNNGVKDILIEDNDGKVKEVVNDYLSYLKQLTETNNLSSSLLTLSDLKKLGCVIPDTYSYDLDVSTRTCQNTNHNRWFSNGQTAWTHSSVSPTWQELVWAVAPGGSIGADHYQNAFGIRPTITIPKETLMKLNS